MTLDHYQGIVVFGQDLQYYEDRWKHKYTDIYCVCKGECDRKMETVAKEHGYVTSWNDVSDLVIPIEFLKFVIAIMNRMRNSDDIYTDEAYENLKGIIIALAQITMKRQSERDIQRLNSLSKLPEGL